MRAQTQLSRALTILARAEAAEIDLHTDVDAWGAPGECHALVGRGQARRDRIARKHAEAEARRPLRVIRRETQRRAGFTPSSADPKWHAIVARCCRFGR
jgi:hypothetical protein